MSNLSPRAPAQDARKKRPLDLQRISFMWDLWTGLYMLEPWEKMVFSASPANCSVAPCVRLRGCRARRPRAATHSPPAPCLAPFTHAPTARALPDGFLVVLFSSLLYYFV